MTDSVKLYLQEHFELPENVYNTKETIEKALSNKINQLIQTNFDHLVNLLYRIDVNEKKLRELLLLHPQEDAGKIIAQLIIERQLQKIKNMEMFSKQNTADDTEEKW